jgi:valyl-tRNA synthetase
MPFVTEEIYSYVPGAEGLLAAGIPDAGAAGVTDDGGVTDEQAEAALGRLIDAVQALRAWRDQAGVRPGATLGARLAVSGGYEETAEHLQRLARLSCTGPDDGELPVASVPIAGGAVEIFASGELDLEAAGRKLAARREQLEAEIQRAERKLSNDGFVSKAPEDVVDAERDKLTRLRDELAAL